MKTTSLTGSNKSYGTFGFTLIELTLVTLIIMVIIGLAAPQFKNSLVSIETNNTVYNLVKLINYAQEMAVIEKLDYKMNIDESEGAYFLTRRKPSGEEDEYIKVKGRYGRIYRLPNRLSIECPDEAVIFYPDGTCTVKDIIIKGRTEEERNVIKIKGYLGEIEVNENQEGE